MSADWFKHDAGARNDKKLRTLRLQKGAAAVCYYWDLVEILTESDGFEIERRFFDAVADDLRISIKELAEVVEAMIDLKLLEGDKRAIWSAGHKVRMAEYDKKRLSYSEAAKAREDKKRAIAATKDNEKQVVAKPDHNSTTILPQQGHEASTLLYSTLINSDPDLGSKIPCAPFGMLLEDHGPVDLKALQSAPEVRSARLCFSRNDAAALIMNHYHGDAGRFVEHVREATDHRIKNGLDSLNSERSSAVIRGWIKTAAQIRKGGPAATPKKTNLDRIKEFAQEAQNDTRSGDEDYELDSFGVRREVRAISAPVKSVVRGDGTR